MLHRCTTATDKISQFCIYMHIEVSPLLMNVLMDDRMDELLCVSESRAGVRMMRVSGGQTSQCPCSAEIHLTSVSCAQQSLIWSLV
jgi:hypothetical protein